MSDFSALPASPSAPTEAPQPAVLDIHRPPFTKKRAGRHYVWSDELTVAYDFAAREGLRFSLSFAAYQVAKMTGQGVRILVYPHKTKSTGNISLRVRDENSADPNLADDLMAKMDALIPDCNTFSRHLSETAWEREKARRQRETTAASAVGTSASECTQ